MKRNNRKWLWLGGVAAYLLTLCLLVLIERRDPNASIQSFADALWYSLVTMSTVGYGDLYPVTDLGRVLGVVFVLLSLGMLTFVISMVIRIVTGKMLPAIRLFHLRNRHWYLFSDRNPCSLALAEDLAKQHPGCVLLFPEEGEEELPEGGLTYSGAMETLAAKKKTGCSLFFLEGDSYAKAVTALELSHPVYCQTEYAPDTCPAGLVLFNRNDCCAQSYWKRYGISKNEHTILLLGDGSCARYLLNRGLMQNVFSSDQKIHYHVFGNWENYRRNHHGLYVSICMDSEADEDALIFHEDAWNEDPELLARADRIILCRDDFSENLALLSQLRQYFATGAQVHLLAEREIPGETVFGTNETIFTEELVLRDQQSRAARQMHEIYLEDVPQAPTWEQLSEFLRQSNIAAADHLLTKIRILLEDDGIERVTAENCAAAFSKYQTALERGKEEFRWIEHQRWMRFHSLYNWRYGSERDNPARIHPMMIPYEKLSPQEQQKDDYAWELMEKLAKKLEEK